MITDTFYDIAIIGGGISSCVFASSHIKNGFKGKIALIENGRNLGGRSSTRKSFSNSGWQLNHGAPNFNICNRNNNKLLKNFIEELLDLKIIQPDSSDLSELYEESRDPKKIYSHFYSGKNYISVTSMSDLSKQIILKNNSRNQIDYFFETLIIELNFENNCWTLTSKNGNKFRSKFIVCSSNLIMHKRSLDIFKVKEIPLKIGRAHV